MSNVKTYKLDAAFTLLKDFDFFAKPDDFVEVSLWHNGEGFDVHLSSSNDQTIQLTWGQFKAIKKLVKELDK